MSKNKNAPIVVLEASKQPFLSIGTIYGAISFNGQKYTYIKAEDAFVRQDYLAEYNKCKKWDKFIEKIKLKND